MMHLWCVWTCDCTPQEDRSRILHGYSILSHITDAFYDYLEFLLKSKFKFSSVFTVDEEEIVNRNKSEHLYLKDKLQQENKEDIHCVIECNFYEVFYTKEIMEKKSHFKGLNHFQIEGTGSYLIYSFTILLAHSYTHVLYALT